MRIICLLLFFTVAFRGFADEPSCVDVNLNDPIVHEDPLPNGVSGASPLDDIPTMAQNGTGTCYGHSASVLIDYYRFSNSNIARANNNRTDPFHLTYLTTSDEWWVDSDLDFGFADYVIKSHNKHGYCPRPLARASLRDDLGGNLSKPRAVSFLTDFYHEYHDIERTNRYASEVLTGAFAREQDGEWFRQAYCSVRENWEGRLDIGPSTVFPTFDILKDLMGTMRRSTAMPMFREIFKERCPNDALVSGPVPEPSNFGGMYTSASQYQNKVASLLGKKNNPQPVEISYCSNTLKSPAGTDTWHYRGRVWGARDCNNNDGHSSVIVGMRNNGGTCQVMIKNSWGMNHCTQYHDDWYADCTPEGVWVDAEHILSNVTSGLVWLE